MKSMRIMSMLVIAVAMAAVNGLAAEVKPAGENPYLGVWRSGSRSDGYKMGITDGGQGLVFAYIGAFPLRWDAVSNGVVRVQLCKALKQSFALQIKEVYSAINYFLYPQML